MDFSPTAGPPPRLSSRLPPVLLSESHLTARGHSLGPPRMWQHHAISKVPHLTAPPSPTSMRLKASHMHHRYCWNRAHMKSLSVLHKISTVLSSSAISRGYFHRYHSYTAPPPHPPHSYSLLLCLPHYSQIFYNPFQIKVIPLKHSTWERYVW